MARSSGGKRREILERMGRDEVRYAGSPLKLSSSEIPQNKSFVVVGIKQKDGQTKVKYRLVPVEPLRNFF